MGQCVWWGGGRARRYRRAQPDCAARRSSLLSQPCVRRDAAAVRALFGARGLLQTDYVHRRQPQGQWPELLPGTGRRYQRKPLTYPTARGGGRGRPVIG